MIQTNSMEALKFELTERWKEWRSKLELDEEGRLIHPSGHVATLLKDNVDKSVNVLRWRCGILYKMPLHKELMFSITLEFRLNGGKQAHEVFFDPPIWHPHVNSETGKLEQFFAPRTTCIERILEDICQQINRPNSLFPLITPNRSATWLYVNKRSSYNRRFLEEAKGFDRCKVIERFDLNPQNHCFVVDLPETPEEQVQTFRTQLPQFKTEAELMLESIHKSLETVSSDISTQYALLCSKNNRRCL